VYLEKLRLKASSRKGKGAAREKRKEKKEAASRLGSLSERLIPFRYISIGLVGVRR